MCTMSEHVLDHRENRSRGVRRDEGFNGRLGTSDRQTLRELLRDQILTLFLFCFYENFWTRSCGRWQARDLACRVAMQTLLFRRLLPSAPGSRFAGHASMIRNAACRPWCYHFCLNKAPEKKCATCNPRF